MNDGLPEGSCLISTRGSPSANPTPGRTRWPALGIIILIATLIPVTAKADRVTLSPGVRIAVRLDNTISTKSRYHYFGNIINATLDQDILDSRGHVAIPAGSMVKLAIPEFKRAGHVFGRARIRLRLFSVLLPDGSEVPLDGYATNLDNNKRPGREGTFHGHHGLVKDAAFDTTAIATGAGVGFAVGGPWGLPAGAAGGLLTAGIWTVARRGPDLVLPAGTVIEFTLGRPASVDEPEQYSLNDPRYSSAGAFVQSSASQGATWGEGLAIPPSSDLLDMLNQLNDPRAVLAKLDGISLRNRSDSDRVFITYLRGICELELSHPKRALDELVKAYSGAKRLSLPEPAQLEIAKNLVVALRLSSKNWQASPLMSDPGLQAVLVAQEGGD